MTESLVKEETPSLEMEKPKRKLYDFENYGIFQLLAYPFVIYLKQFFKYFLIALIPEFIFFGIFQLIQIDVSYIYNDAHSFSYFDVKLDFQNDAAAASFFILLILGLILFIFRSGLISTITWKATEKQGRANPIWALEATFRQTSKFVLAAIIMLFFVALPSIFVILGILFSGNPRLQGLSWTLLVISIGLPLVFGSRICLFSTGITKDYFPAGTSFQKSWELTKGKLWLRTTILLVVFGTLGFLGPVILTQALTEIYGQWAAFGMIFGRALLYPLLDISLSLSYMNAESLAINKAVFKEDIKRQQLISEKFMQSKKNKY
ncbi:MAG: hypothetical protein ACTSO7_08065 [Candidatus Heimdallarchaeota archaeon]